MTSISSAHPRPPATFNLPAGPPRSLSSRPSVKVLRTPVKQEGDGLTEARDADFTDDRPVKRRRLSASSTSIAASSPATAPTSDDVRTEDAVFTRASWLSVVTSHGETIDDAVNSELMPPLPLPDRPWASTPVPTKALESGRPGCRVRKNVAVPTVPDSISVPLDAPILGDQRRADYFPWTGKHPEDVLSESTVKSGYFDRAPNLPDRELNTAKGSIYNALKLRPGLESLSALFSLVLEQKGQHGLYSSVSMFKGPPPRVTLTEAKRKSWIADLANPEVPLRRLSKTIPQGIRGQSLLDQCLTHFVPLNRAIWFTKCVGANEIRTLKRKGTNPTVALGAEAKWLREWTSNIEQFIDQILSQCGQGNWKERIRYAIQLATRMYAANLLDRDHYLDWIVKTFASSNMSQWPFWLMIVNLHGADLLAFRKRGKQTAEILMSKYNVVQSQPAPFTDPLIQRLAQTVRGFVLLRPACFIVPDRWTECGTMLRACLSSSQPREQLVFRYLKLANQRCMGSNRPEDSNVPSQERIVEMLDAVQTPVAFPRVLETLHQVCTDQKLLMTTCAQWCTSRYRTGLTRIYLVARLFRKWHRKGLDIDSALLECISEATKSTSVDAPAFRHLFSELSRSHTFSVSKYLQWLTVRGMPHAGSAQKSTAPVMTDSAGNHLFLDVCHDSSQLLTEICLAGEDDHVHNMRNAMLERAGVDEDDNTVVFQHYRDYLDRLLAGTFSEQSFIQNVDQKQLPWSLRTRLSHWLRARTIELTKAAGEGVAKATLVTAEVLSAAQFNIIRHALEQLQDVAVLADVLRISAFTKQEDVLATVVDTVNFHSASLSAIGALEPLQELLCEAYLRLRPVKTSMPLLATSLIELCQQFPTKTAPVRALQHDFIRGDRSRAIAACSPFSDGVAESLQQAGESFHDDFEAILQTESNMNEQTTMRLFNVLVDRIEKSQEEGQDEQHVIALCQLLCRLKLCRVSQGDILLRKWLVKLTSNSSKTLNTSLLLYLVYTRCLRLEMLLEISQQLPSILPSKRSLQGFIRSTMSTPTFEQSKSQVWYGVKLAGAKFMQTDPGHALEVLVIGNEFRGPDDVDHAMVTSMISNPESIKVLSRPASVALSQKLADILGETQVTGSALDHLKVLAAAAGPLSMPFCQFRIRMLCQTVSVKNDDKAQEDVANVLYTAIADPNAMLRNSPLSIQSLLKAAGPVIGTKIKAKVEQAFFQVLPKFLQGKTATHYPMPSSEENEVAMRALRHVAGVNVDGVAQNTGVTLLIEKLSLYLKCLGSSTHTNSQSYVPSSAYVQSPTATTSAPPFPNPSADLLRAFLLATMPTLRVLMQTVCIKRSAFISSSLSQPSPAAAKQAQQDQIKLLGLVVTIATHSAWNNLLASVNIGTDATTVEIDGNWRIEAKDMIEFMFDVAATLVDDMAEESRIFCTKILKEKVRSDERVRWLIGCVNVFGSLQCSVRSWEGVMGGAGAGAGNLQMWNENKNQFVGEFRPKVWEMLESHGGGGGANDGCIGLGLFGARKA